MTQPEAIVMTTRRQFIAIIPAGAVALALSRAASAQPARLEETDPGAVALGYKHDATKVDTTKHANYKPGQVCANCALYQGKPTDEWAACGAVGDRLVNGKGWCIAWVKKAA